MSAPFEPTDELDARLALGATGLLREANLAGVVTAADVHLATRLGRLAGEADETVLLAVALGCASVREGSVGLDLDAVVLPEALTRPDDWAARVGASPLAGAGAVRLDLGLLYLERYWEQEVQVAADLRERLERPAPPVDEAVLEAALDRLFDDSSAEQREAARAAATRWTTVVTGGPGTGKTHTVARVLALLTELAQAAGDPPPRVALAAPTAKAATRLRESVRRARVGMDPADRERVPTSGASTLHRLLGWRRGSRTRFAHDRSSRLPHDVVVVDEASMLSLTMMARLLEAVRPDARLVLVGDPDQLASVEAGAVLADVVRGRPEPVAALTVGRRYDRSIGELASAIRDGDADAALAAIEQSPAVRLVADVRELRGELVGHALALRERAQAGDGAGALELLDRHRLLCAHRAGRLGVAAWNRTVEQWLAEDTGERQWAPMYLGRPVLVTRNDYAAGLLNGDTGVVVRGENGPEAVMSTDSDDGSGVTRMGAGRLSEVETMHAATVHKMQGSQVQDVTLLLPEADSPLLTRELLYTAVTRAQRSVTVVGTPELVRAAVEHRVQRSSALAERLQA